MKAKKQISQYDKMTKTPVSSLIVRLSVPTVISMMITNIYNLADTAFVGRISNSASGAVGIVFGFMAIIQAIGFMMGNGSGSIISRLLGKKDNKNATIIASTGFFFSIFFGALISLVSFLTLGYLVMILGSTETIAPYAKDYITYILIASPFMTADFLMNNILRYEGKATFGMIGLSVGAILNIIGDPIFMFIFNLGISGAGISTMISQIISFFILLSMFLRGKTVCKFSIKKINVKCLYAIITTGLPSLLRQGLNSFGTVLLNTSASVYGDAAVAAMSIVSRVIFFAFSIALGVGQGFQPVCGFNFGAKKFDRLKKAFIFTLALSQIFIILMSVIIFIFPGDIIRIFRNDSAVVEIGARALVLQGISQLFMPFCMLVELTLQCVGERFKASFLSTLKSGLFFIPLLFLLQSIRGLSGIQEAQPLAVILSFIPSVIFAVSFFRKLTYKLEE